MKKRYVGLITFIFLFNFSIFAEGEHHHDHMMKETPPAVTTDNLDIANAVGVDEKLGTVLPLDKLRFTNEKREEVTLKQVIQKPTLLLLVFYHCTMTCSLMLGELSGVVQHMDQALGKDYQIISVSFDDEDDTEVAIDRKKNFLHLLEEDQHQLDAWTFLTGSATNIKTLTEGVGFRYKKMGPRNFVHPNVLIALSPEGKVIRYLYGPSFLPFDVSMALTEAAKGTPGVSIKRILSYCLIYDSKNKKYMVNFTRIGGALVLSSLGVFLFFTIRRPKNKKIN